IAAALGVLGEQRLLAPVMDGFGITDPFWKDVSALVIVIVASAVVEISTRHIRSFGEGEFSRFKAVITTAFTGLTLRLLVLLGWWRSEEMIFAGSLHKDLLAQFLGQNPTLTRSTVTLLTAALPVF